DGVVEVCGDMSFKSNSATTLPAALYYMEGTSNLSWQNGSVTGTGVTIAMNGGSITINGNMGVTLTAPTTGTYRGIVIYQKRGLASPPNQKLNGGSTQDFMGSLYLPGSQVTYTGGSATSITALIGDTIVFSGNSIFGT